MQIPSRRFILALATILVGEALAIELLSPRIGMNPGTSIVATMLVAGFTAYIAAGLRQKSL